MNKKLLLLGVSLLTLIPASVIYNRFKPTHKLIERKTMLHILRTMKRRYYPILKQIAFMFQKIKNETKLPEDQITELIMGPEKPSSLMLRKIDKEILTSNKISQEDFKYSYKIFKEQDIEIGLLIEEMKMEISMASKGNLKQYKGAIPYNMTSQKTLEIFVQMIKIQMTEQVKIYRQTITNPDKPQLSEYDEIIESSEIDDYLDNQNLNSEFQHPGKLVHQAIQNYFQKDPQFRRKLLSVKSKFEAISNKVLQVKVTIRSNQPVNLVFLDQIIEQIKSVSI